MSWNQNPYQQQQNMWPNQPGFPPTQQQGVNQPPQMPAIFPEQQSGFQQMPSYPPQQTQFPGYGQNMPQSNQPYQGGYPQYPSQQSGPFNAVPSQQVQLMPIGSGQKKALLVGINYINTPAARLNGPINDVQNMMQFLSQRGYQNMWVLTDDQDPSKQPTRQNMIQGMQWLVQGARPGDSLVFHYSGHGSQMLDTNGDEVDGFDEVILPCDYKMAGYIVDDDLHNILVKSLPYGTRLTAIMDCCHSGTGMDLPYVHEAVAGSRGVANLLMYDKHMLKKNKKMKKEKKDKKEKKSKKKKGHLREIQQLAFSQQSIGDVVEFSGCKDDQTAADTTFSGFGQVKSGGAMTTAFIQAANRSPQQSFADVLYGMRQILQQQGQTQIPQLSSDRPMDLNQMFAL